MRPGDESIPHGKMTNSSMFNGGSDGLFDATLLEPFYGSLGDVTGFDLPPAGLGDENDIWAQLFNGHS
jgi:hypothetical protein